MSEVVLNGRVQTKVFELPKDETEMQRYIPLKGQLVIVNSVDGNNTVSSLYVGDGITSVASLTALIAGTNPFATNTSVGVVRGSPSYGTTIDTRFHSVRLKEATATAINNKTAPGGSGYGVITSNNYDLLPNAGYLELPYTATEGVDVEESSDGLTSYFLPGNNINNYRFLKVCLPYGDTAEFDMNQLGLSFDGEDGYSALHTGTFQYDFDIIDDTLDYKRLYISVDSAGTYAPVQDALFIYVDARGESYALPQNTKIYLHN